MSLLKKLLSDKKVVASALSTLLLLVTVVTVFVVMLPRTKAWFAKNDNVTAGGMSLSAKEDYLRFDDTFTAKAVMGGVTVSQGTFKRADDGKYYLHDGNQFLLTDGKKQSLFYDSLFPGEYIEFTMRFTCAEERINSGYKLYFQGLNKSDTFTTKTTDDSVGKTYSILGVYRLAVVSSVGGTETEIDKGFLDSYADDVTNDTFAITEGMLNKSDMDAEGYITLKFRLYIDLEQYNTLQGTYSNLLSEKNAVIDNIVLAPKEEN